MSEGWTPDRVNRLRKLWSVDGLSAAEIAADLRGFDDCDDGGRHAVLSQIYRQREAAKDAKNADEIKVWTRGKQNPPRGGGYRRKKPAKPLSRQRANALNDSVVVSAIKWPTDDEVTKAWIAQITKTPRERTSD